MTDTPPPQTLADAAPRCAECGSTWIVCTPHPLRDDAIVIDCNVCGHMVVVDVRGTESSD